MTLDPTLGDENSILAAFYRLVGTDEDDTGLAEQGEATNDVAYYCLTRGIWAAQRRMLQYGYDGWRTTTSAITWLGSDSTGGRYVALPSDFLRACGDRENSPLREATGRRWGKLLEDNRYDDVYGDFWFIRPPNLRITRQANPPTTLYLHYYKKHTEFSDGVSIDFEEAARPLIVAEAANFAKDDNWLLGGPDWEGKIVRALVSARQEAREVARGTKAARRFHKPVRHGNRW